MRIGLVVIARARLTEWDDIVYLANMWGWFKKKSVPSSDEVGVLFKEWLGPQALAVAVAEIVHEHFDAVEAGEVTYPSHRRKREHASVVDIWRDLRLEALHNLYNFGKADAFRLSEAHRQSELLDCFLDERPHLEMPQPRGEIVPDTVQAMGQVYVYLSKVGSEVGNPKFDLGLHDLADRFILDNLTAQAKEIREAWRVIECTVLSDHRSIAPQARRFLSELVRVVWLDDGSVPKRPQNLFEVISVAPQIQRFLSEFERNLQSNAQLARKVPRTLFEIVYEDVTAKAKSIALSAVWGPEPKAMIKFMGETAAKRSASITEVAEFHAIFDRLMDAKDPDHFAQ